MKRQIVLVLVMVILFLLGEVAQADLSFQGLGLRADYDSLHISGDGLTVVGMSAGSQGFRWTAGTGIQSLGTAFTSGLSYDGSVVINSGKGIWTESQGWQSLPFSPYRGGISADGSVVVGTDNSGPRHAVRWTEYGGMKDLGDLPGGGDNSQGFGVSADGSVATGMSWGVSGFEAFYWTESDGMVGLGDLPGGQYQSEPYGISADGSVIVGMGSSQDIHGLINEAFRWTKSEGMVGLGHLPYDYPYQSLAYDASGDGSIVVGYANGEYYDAQGNSIWSQDAFIWDADNGMRFLQDVLENDYGLDLGGYNLQMATSISDDGLTIVGTGYNQYGQDDVWVAVTPIPSAVILGSLGLTFSGWLLKRKRMI